MPEFTANAVQTVAVGQNVLFTDTPVPCKSGYVVHREGAGLVTLRGIVNNCGCFARYKVSFGGNIAVPTDETVGPISVAIAIGGEPVGPSTAIITPAAVDEFGNVFTSVFVTVPKGCCFSIAVKNTSDIPIDVQNANLIIERTA